MITLCKTCGTSYEVTGAHPEQCDICQDERQYVPASGQEWVDFTALCASHTNKWKHHDSTLLTSAPLLILQLISARLFCVPLKAIFYGTALPRSTMPQKR